MKNLITLSLFVIAISANVFCQPPQAFKYQAVVRDAGGDVISNQAVDIRISIHDVTVVGTIVYQEFFSVTTNEFGLVSLDIGLGTPVGYYNFESIDWSADSKFIEIEIDDLGGGGYVSMGTSELFSVPYALYSKRASGGVWNSSGSNLYYDGGFVGIGTSAPYTDLIVKSSGYTHGMYVLSDDDDPLFRVRQNSDGSGGIYLYDETGAEKINIHANFDSHILGNLSIGNTSPLGRFSIESPTGTLYNMSNVKGIVIKDGNFNTGNDLEIQRSDGFVNFVVSDAGRVGIGTDFPNAGLHVKGGNWPSSFLYLQSNDDADAGIRLYEGETAQWHIFNNSVADGLQIYNADASSTVFYADQVTGGVGIGTVAPAAGYRLSVDGKVACEEVLVEYSEGWPDFVFSEDYELLSLDDLERQIKENSRLPGIPSAEEVKENGFHLADMQKQVLQKVEELTLYTIEQGKLIKDLQKEMEILKAENKLLRNEKQ